MKTFQDVTMSSLIAGYFIATGNSEFYYSDITKILNDFFKLDNLEVIDTNDDNDKICLVISFSDKSIVLNYKFNDMIRVNNNIITVYDYLYSLTDDWIRNYFNVNENIKKRTKTIA